MNFRIVLSIRCFNKRYFSLALVVAMASCSPKLQRTLTTRLVETDARFQDHTGFALFDIAGNKMVYEYRADRYFTPASNTKILTLYTCFTILGDSIPALKYVETEDSLVFWGSGDPSFLNNKVIQSD